MEQFNFGPAKVQVADELNSKVDKNQGSQHAGKVLGIGNDGAVTPVPFSGLDTKVDKNQGVQHAGKALGIGSDGMVTPVAFSGEDFTGATATTNGVHGYVPAPLAGEQAKVLTGDGTWQVSPGAKVYVKTITVTNTSGTYSQTFEDDNIVADMKAVELEVTRAYVFGDVITVTPANGSITVACSDVSGTDTIKISLIKVISDPTAITSTEFDILNNRLLAVENVYTDTSINIATSSWTLSSDEYVYTWVSQNVTTACGIEVFLMDGAENAGIESFEYEKVTGGVKFTSAVQPTGSLPVTIRIINAKASDIETITADMVATDVITGAVNVEEALEILDEKPDYATEMPVSSSDSTTVSEALTSQSQAIANLIEYGSNSNGEYWKYSNGMLICSKRVAQTVNTWTAWGTAYESETISLGSHPYEFKSGTTPKVQATLTNSSASGWLANITGLTNALVGAIKVIRPNNPGTTSFGIDILAIGFWK